MSFFLRHFAGFLIQIGASMLLCLIPFRKEDFRYPRKWVLTGYSILAIAVSACFPLAKGLMPYMPFDQPTILSNLYMLLVLVVFIALYFWVVRTEVIKKFIVLVLVVFYAATQYLLVNLTSPLFPDGSLPDTYPPLTLTLYAVTALVMFPVAALLMKRAVGDYLAEIEMKNIKREFSVVLLVTALYFVMLFLYSSRPDSDIGDFWWWVTPPFLLAAVILCIFYWTLFRESVRRKRDSEQQRALEIQQLQYEKITQEMEQARRIRHDMRHYLASLSDMLEQGKTEEMKDYLSEVIENTAKRGSEVYCRNATVNGLLQYYAGLAAGEGIRCEVQADCGELTVSAVDLTVLFGNAMENAIRACQEFEENRYILVQVAVMGGSLMVQVINPCKDIHPSGSFRLDGGFLPAAAFRSTRTGGGYGLKSIEHTAMKYDGNASFRFDDTNKTFTTRIRLNLHPEKL